MSIFSSSKISIDQIDGYMKNLITHPLLSDYYVKWGEFVESNPNLWIKEKTELDMIIQMNLDSISVTINYLLNSRDQKKLKKMIDECNKLSVGYSCLIGVGFSVLNKKALTNVSLLPDNIRKVFDLTFLPSYKLFEIIFDAHYKINTHMAFQRDGHLEDTKRGIIRRTITSCLEGSKAAAKLKFVIF